MLRLAMMAIGLSLFLFAGCTKNRSGLPKNPVTLVSEIKPPQELFKLGQNVDVKYIISNISREQIRMKETSKAFSYVVRFSCDSHPLFLIEPLIVGEGVSGGHEREDIAIVMPGKSLNHHTAVALKCSGELAITAVFDNMSIAVGSDVPGDFQGDYLLSPATDEAGGKYYRGRLYSTMDVSVGNEPARDLEEHVSRLVGALLEDKPLPMSELMSVIEMAPGFVAERLLKKIWKIAPAKRFGVLKTLMRCTADAGGHEVVEQLYHAFEKSSRRFNAKELLLLRSLFREVGEEGVSVTDYEYRYQFKPDAYRRILATITRQESNQSTPPK